MTLRLRLALWYGALTGVVVFLFTLASYAVHSRTYYDELDVNLRRDAEHVAAEITEASTAQERAKTFAASLILGAGMRLYSATGALLQQSMAAQDAPPMTPDAVRSKTDQRAFSPIARLVPVDAGTQGPRIGSYRLLQDEHAERWRVYVLPVEGDGYFAAMVPLARIDRAVADFGRAMALAAIFGTVLPFIVGWLLARRVLRPLAVLTADAISQSKHFAYRVPHGGTHDELELLSRTLNEMLDSLDEAYQAQQRFVASASHELRAPLTAVQANLELLRTRHSSMSDGDRSRAVDESYTETVRMSRLVGDLLLLARADAGVPLRSERIEIDRILLDVLFEMRHVSADRSVDIGRFEPAMVSGDPDRLRQVLVILLDNALKYTLPQGTVTVSLHRSDAHVEIVVDDDGIGISADDLPRVFERFYRADPARSRASGGSGLGLSIAQWIAGEHRGTLVLSSTLGEGTTATVRLPLAS